MYLEIVVFIGVIITLLFTFAEATKKPALGLIGSVLIFFLGIWIVIDNVQIKTGENQTEIDNGTSTLNGSTAVTFVNMTSTKNLTYQYTNLPDIKFMPPALKFNVIIGLILILMAFYGGLNYAVQFGDNKIT